MVQGLNYFKQNCKKKNPSSRIWTSDLWISAWRSTTVHRSTNWAIEGDTNVVKIYVFIAINDDGRFFLDRINLNGFWYGSEFWQNDKSKGYVKCSWQLPLKQLMDL